MKYLLTLFCLVGMSLYAQTADYEQAWKLYINGQYEDVLTIVPQDHADSRCLFLRGKVLENMYRYEEAIATQQQALQINPAYKEAKVALAALYQMAGQSALSVELYKQLAAEEPHMLRWKMNEASALQLIGKCRDALVLYQDVSKVDSANWIVYKNMGDCFFRLDSLANTALCYQKAVDLYPKNKELYIQLIRLYTNLKQPDEAIRTAKEILQSDSMSIDGWKYMGVAYYRKAQSDSALMAFRKTLALGDTSLTVCQYYGMLCYQTFAYKEAEKYLERVRVADPKDMVTMYYLSIVYGYTGKAGGGIALADTINKHIQPYDSMRIRAETQRGYLYRIQNRYDDAAATFINLTKIEPSKSIYYYEVAVSYDMALKKKQALDWYIRFLNLIDPTWERKIWSEEDLKKSTYQNAAMNRVGALKTDIFFEEGRLEQAKK